MAEISNNDLLPTYVENYYKEIIKHSSINGVSFSYYKSLRGYFKHSILLTDIKQQEFGVVDYKVWERILTLIKSGRNPVESGGIRMKFETFSDLCSKRAYYNTRKKLLTLELLIETPFKHYYILNPRYIIKLYNPKVKEDDGDE